MPAWTTISNALVAVGAKPFATTIQALRDNVEALAEGATGAPKVQGQALGGTLLGGVIISGTTPQNFINLDRGNLFLIDFIWTASGGTASNFEIGFSNDNGATYVAYATLVALASAGAIVGPGKAVINTETGARSAVAANSTNLSTLTTSLTVPSNVNAFRLRASNAAISVFVTVCCLGGRA